jgi:hypothetical protein
MTSECVAYCGDPDSCWQSNPVVHGLYELSKSVDEGCLGDAFPCYSLDTLVSSFCGVRFGHDERGCYGQHCLCKISSTYQKGSARQSNHPTPRAGFEKQHWECLVDLKG